MRSLLQFLALSELWLSAVFTRSSWTFVDRFVLLLLLLVFLSVESFRMAAKSLFMILDDYFDAVFPPKVGDYFPIADC